MGLVEGFQPAFKGLDRQVAEDPDLKDVEIKSIEDKYFILKGRDHGSARIGDEVLSRVVVYRPLEDKL
tara:strand:+ start:194 stop:397 length:204 start_codon:yes stop_codon:yes gene_type:complete